MSLLPLYIILCSAQEFNIDLLLFLSIFPIDPNLPRNPPYPRTLSPPLLPTPHTLYMRGTTEFPVHAAATLLRLLISCRCTAIGSSSDRPTPLRFEELHLGNRTTHSSHNLNIFRGLVFCSKCGARSGRLGFKLLANKCLPPKGYGLASLYSLREGKLPPNLSRWPDENTPISTCDSAPVKGGTKKKGAPFHAGIRLARTRPSLKDHAFSMAVPSPVAPRNVSSVPILNPYQKYLSNSI